MLTIRAKINISGNAVGKISKITSNLKGNNVSGQISEVVDKINIPLGNPFVLGRSVLGVQDTYVDKLPYYMGAQLADENGNFPEKYVITIEKKDLSNYMIVFDKKNDRHPKYVTVDGVKITDDDPQFELSFDSTKTIHTVEIENWNTPDYPLIITSLYAVQDIEITNKNLDSFNSDIADRDNNEYPSFGIISNTANLSFYDFNEEALDLITKKILHSGVTVSVWIGDETTTVTEKICEMQIEKLSYDNNNRSVSLSLKDNLEDLQSINFEGISYTPTVSAPKTAKEIYDILYGATANLNKYNWQSYNELAEEVKDRLNSITIQYPTMESSNLWDSWNKLCQLCLLHIYIDNNNVVVVKCD